MIEETISKKEFITKCFEKTIEKKRKDSNENAQNKDKYKCDLHLLIFIVVIKIETRFKINNQKIKTHLMAFLMYIERVCTVW